MPECVDELGSVRLGAARSPASCAPHGAPPGRLAPGRAAALPLYVVAFSGSGSRADTAFGSKEMTELSSLLFPRPGPKP